MTVERRERFTDPIQKTIGVFYDGEMHIETALSEIEKTIPTLFLDDQVRSFLADVLLPKCSTVSIEFPYFDSDYLSTYYLHYARCFRKYRKECCRIILFGLDEEESCVGYVSLRPLPKTRKIGKTYLNPTVFSSEKGYIICGKYKVHYQGEESTISAMPYMKQEQHVAVCSHVCLWSAIRFFSSRFSNYPNYVMGEIIERVSSPDERKVPSHGLNTSQISSVLMDVGFSCTILRRDSTGFEGAPLVEQLCAYIDSGIPVICISNSLGHAVIACGRTTVNLESLAELDTRFAREQSILNNTPELGCPALILESSLIDGVIVNDDNENPYNKITVHHKSNGATRKRFLRISQIDYCVAPLNSRMQLNYSAAKDIMQLIYHQKEENGIFSYEWRQDSAEDNSIHIMKISLVSSNTFKEWIRENINAGTLPNDFYHLLQIAYPRFCWLGELSSLKEYAQGLCSGFIVLDSTCSPTDNAACIIVADNKKCIVNYSEDTTENVEMDSFTYNSQFQIPLFRKNYEEVGQW